MAPHQVGKYGGYIDPEEIVLAAHGKAGKITACLAQGEDGGWRNGLLIRSSSPGSYVGPHIRSQSFDSREQALKQAAENARRWCRRMLAREHVWMQNRVHAEAAEMLRQIDAAYPPPGTQLSLF